jgi:predicted phosphodiesterase
MRTKSTNIIEGTPDLIICSDIHLREDIPVSRTDDFWAAQWKKLDFISNLQKKYNCSVIHGGDLFHHWKPSPFLISKAIQHLPDKFLTIYGQHDLPQHNLELAYKCGINTLEKAGKIKILNGCHFGQEPTDSNSTPPILVWHTFNYQGKLPWPDCPASTASKLLKKYPQFDLIITGDNHQSFVEELNGRILVNPGSMMRTTADQIDFRPSVYLYYSKSNSVKRVYLPIEADVISREHITRKEERDNRLESFISKLNTDWEADVSFEENVTRMMEENKTKEAIKKIVNQAVFE